MERQQYRVRLGSVIAQLRAVRGMSQAHLAESLNRSEAAVSRWEHGRGTPSAFDLAELARIFGLHDDQLDLLLRPPKPPDGPVAERLRKG